MKRWLAILPAALVWLGIPGPSYADADASPGGSGAAPALVPASGAAASASASALPTPPASEPESGQRIYATCREHLPQGKDRPKISESFPEKGLSGYALPLKVEIEHGKGETVMPGDLTIRLDTDEAKALEKTGFFLPDPKGDGRPTRETVQTADRANTKVVLQFVALPKEPGRHELELPPIPISLARASGEVLTVCTRPHAIVIDDPIASIPDAKPKNNPPARRQKEEWTAAKHAAIGGLLGLVVAALVTALIVYLRRRPKPEKPPPPPRPPWDIAMEELFDIRNAGLIERQRFQTHFDRVSHAVRRYLGDRYGFDGLETTTREMLEALRNIHPEITVMAQIEAFLAKADLVKFAKLTPTEAECEGALGRGEAIVVETIPPQFRPQDRTAQLEEEPT